MDDNVSWAVEFIMQAKGVEETTKRVTDATRALQGLADGALAAEKDIAQSIFGVQSLGKAMETAFKNLGSQRLGIRMLGSEAKELGLALNDTVSSFERLSAAKASDVAARSLKDQFNAARELDFALQNVLRTYREFGREANSRTALKNLGAATATPLVVNTKTENADRQIALLRQQIELTQQLTAERIRATEALNATPFTGAGRLTNGTSGAIFDEQERLAALGRAAASDALRRQMEGSAAAKATGPLANDKAIAGTQAEVTAASQALRTQMEQNAAVAAQSAAIMGKSQQVAVAGLRQTITEAERLGKAFTDAARLVREGGKNDGLAQQYEEKAAAVAKLVQELEAAARVSSLAGLKRVATPQIGGLGEAINPELFGAAAKELGLITTEANTATEANTRLAGALARVRAGIRADAQETRTFGEAMALSNAALSKRNGLGNFYPLIVASGLFAGLSHATLGFAAASIKTAADYQQAFASVARTTSTAGNDTQVQIEAIHKSLLDLSTQMPATFQDLSKVATAGNQLGIPAQNIAKFTEVVSQFSAITGGSAEETAKSIGSLIQILHLGQNEFANLASSVTLVGRKSVATESEVLAMTTKIGAIAHVAGFSAQETVGLAAAFSSLREPVERSQGALTTYTKVVDKAAAAGGAKFQKFADVIGTTSENAQKLLRQKPYEFFRQFLAGISQLDAITQTKTLGDLGLSNVRISEVLTRLADNLKVVDSTQRDAAAGYKGGTDLATQYAKATATLAAKFQELQNAVGNLFNTLGASGLAPILTNVVSGFRDAVVAVNDFLQKNAGIATVVVAISAVVGVLALLRGAMIAAAIAAYALENAELRVGGAQTIGNLRTIANLMFGFKTATAAATVETRGLAVGQEALATKTEATSTSLKAAGIAARFFGSALGGALVVGAGLAALTAIFSAIEQHNADLHDSFNSVDLSGAIAKDTAEFNKGHAVILTYTETTRTAKNEVAPWVKALERAVGAQADLTDKTNKATEAVKNQTIAYGYNAQEAIKKALVDNTQLQGLFSGDSLGKLKGTGFKFNDFIQAALGDPEKGAQQYIDKIEKALKAKSDVLSNPGGLFNGSGINAGIQIKELEKYREVVDAAGGSLIENINKQALANAIMGQTGPKANEAAAGVVTLAQAIADESKAASDSANAHQAFIASIQPIIDDVFRGANAFFAQQSALQSLGKEYVDSGAYAAFAGQGIQQVVAAALQGTDSFPQAADALQEIVNAMVAGGYVTGPYADQLSYLNGIILKLGGSADKKSADITAFVQGIAQAQQSAASSATKMGSSSNKAADALDKEAEAAQRAADHAQELAQKAQDAAAAFRTTADYANDLGTVLQRAFDIQFAPQQAADQIASTFNDMRKSAQDATTKIRDARKEIQGINADIAKLQSDNVQQSYFLGIANAFGDRIGAAAIQAQMAQNQQGIVDKQASKKDQFKNIDEGFAQLDTATQGNSDAAIRNRAALTGLVSNYEDWITKLAASGLSQKELAKKVEEARQNFLSQGRALGFSKRQLDPYAKAMSGFIEIIKKVPRKVSVEVKSNVSAAQNTLNEFYAKLKLDNAAKAAEAAAKFKEKYAQGIQKAAQDARKKANTELGKIGIGVKTHPPIFPTPHIPGAVNGRPRGIGNALVSADMEEIGMINKRFQAALAGGASERQLAAIMRDMKNASFNLDQHRRAAGLPFYGGGYTGPGGKYVPAGIVHKGEYVVPQHLVNQRTGLPYADALGRLVAGTRPQAGYAAGGYVNSDIMVVEPGPAFKRELRAIVQNEIAAVIEPRAIAGANQDYTTQQRRRGSNR